MAIAIQELIRSWAQKHQLDEREVARLIEANLNNGLNVVEAVKEAFESYGVTDILADDLSALMIRGVELGYGLEPGTLSADEVIQRALWKPWRTDGVVIPGEVTKAMREAVVKTIQQQQMLNATALQLARALYDGYGYGQTISRTNAPKYLRQLYKLAKDGQYDTEAFKLQYRKAQDFISTMTDDSPNKALKTAYRQLMRAVESGNEKALRRAIYVATEEKSRYIAERVARTETARAYFDGFVAKYDGDKRVVAYKWNLNPRHRKTDICDFYAKADLYSLGAGIYPKDRIPELPLHSHCLCNLTIKTKRMVDMGNLKARVSDGAKEYLDSLSEPKREDLLGVNGAREYGVDKSRWKYLLHNYQEPHNPVSRLKPEWLRKYDKA